MIQEEILRTYPNVGSKFSTPTSCLVDKHYGDLQLFTRWTWERYLRLAAFLKLSPYELGSVTGIPHSAVERWKLKSPIPISPSEGGYSAALVLTILEAHVCGELLGDTIANPFPDLSQTPPPRPD